MELTEKIESINRQLVDLFGVDTITGKAMWRVVWSEDQFEHRHGTYDDFTPEGFYLRTVTETRYVPKYSQWIRERYVLERLVLVPEVNYGDLPVSKMSYEPMFPFVRNNGDYLPPRLDVAKFVIDTVLEKQGKKAPRYTDPVSGMNTEDYLESKAKEIEDMQRDLFGNETDTGDALAHGEAVIVPRNYNKES